MRIPGPFILAPLCAVLVGCTNPKPYAPAVPRTTFSSFDQPLAGEVEKTFGRDEINLKGAWVKELLLIYEDTSGRTVISPATLPSASITLHNQAPVTRTEVLQLYDSVLAQNGIAMVLSGEKSVKAVPLAMAAQEAGPVVDLPADKLPDSGSYMVRIVHLKKVKPSEMVPMVQPFAKVPNGIIPMDKQRILILRDLSANIRQMLKVIDLAEPGAGR